MSNSYIQQTSSFTGALPNIIPQAQQQSNQIQAIVTDITNIVNAINGLNGNGSTGSSWFSTQNVVTGQRALNTVYQNTTGRTMFVAVSIAGANPCNFFTDSNPSPSAQVSNLVGSGSGWTSIYAMVLPNNYYKVSTTSSLTGWTEWY